MAYTLQHQPSAAAFAAYFWADVKRSYASNKPRWERLIWWIYNRVQAGDLTVMVNGTPTVVTNDMVRQSFNAAFGRSLTLSQWNAFVTNKLLPIVSRYEASQAESDL